MVYRRVKGRLKNGKPEHDLIGELEKFARSIDNLSDEAKNLLGPLREEAVNGEVATAMLSEQLRHHLQVLMDIPDGKPGRAEQMARHEALCEARNIWVEKGGEPALGQLRRESRGGSFHINAFTRFLADCLLNIDAEIRTPDEAAVAAHSVLRRGKR